MKVATLGIDLAKSVFQLHGVDAHGKVAIQKRGTRSKLLETVAQLPVCVIGKEACASAQYWAREFQQLGHTVKLISPQFVKPYVEGTIGSCLAGEMIQETTLPDKTGSFLTRRALRGGAQSRGGRGCPAPWLK